MIQNSDEKAFKQYCEVNRDSIHPDDLVQYENQYDPNNDYAIFGIGDPTRGGIQTMQEKMNIADKPVHTDSSEEEDEYREGSAPSGTKLDSQGSGKGSDSTGGKTPINDLPEDKEIHSDDE